MAKLDPYSYAEPNTEHAHQVALFMALAMASNYGFTAALDPKSYGDVKHAQWLSYQHKDGDVRCRLAHAIPNGGERNRIVAARMKSEGVRAGVPDVFLPVAKYVPRPPTGPTIDYEVFHGHYTEMKKPGEEKKKDRGLSDAQTTFHMALRAEGYRVVTCYHWLDAFNEIKWYLGHA